MKVSNARYSCKGFTLIEVAMAIGILSFGLTAVVSVYMVSLKWAEDIRINLTALQSGRVALYDAGVLLKADRTSAGFDNRDVEAKGYVNDYFVVRSYDSASKITLPHNAGNYVEVEVKVYYGGDDQDGSLRQRLFSHQIVHSEYAP